MSWLCRLCLSYVPTNHTILTIDETVLLEALTSIKFCEEDAESLIICMKCKLHLKLVNKFKHTIIRTNKKLLLIRETTIKDEPAVGIKRELDLDRSTNQVLFDENCIICGLSPSSHNVEKHFTQEQNCNSCKKLFNNISSYRHHVNITHPNENLYKCSHCNATFLYESLYYTHLEHLHKVNRTKGKAKVPLKDITCNICSKTFMGERRLLNHMAEHEVKYCCDICSKVSPDKQTHSRHVYTHKRKQCPFCHKQISVGNLLKHVEIHKDSEVVCEICGAKSKNKESLRHHVKRMHHESQSFACGECGKVFKWKINYNKHLEVHKGKAKLCDTCGKKFHTKERLDIHIKMTHLQLRPYICPFCKKGFCSRHALSTHKRQHTKETPFRCEICGEGFRQRVSLKNHNKSKHNIIEPVTCECKVCGKGFASEWALLSHSRIHS